MRRYWGICLISLPGGAPGVDVRKRTPGPSGRIGDGVVPPLWEGARPRSVNEVPVLGRERPQNVLGRHPVEIVGYFGEAGRRCWLEDPRQLGGQVVLVLAEITDGVFGLG